MKITSTRLKQLIKEKIEESLGGYYGDIRPTKRPPPVPKGQFTRVRSSGLEERVAEIIEKIGKDKFVEELIKITPDEGINTLIQKIAKEKNLTVGGVQYFENKESNEEEKEEEEEESEDEYTKLGPHKEDPMGRGARTSALRKSVMGPILADY